MALANLLPAQQETDDLDSWMYQTVGHQLVGAYAQCMGLPLYRRHITGRSADQVGGRAWHTPGPCSAPSGAGISKVPACPTTAGRQQPPCHRSGPGGAASTDGVPGRSRRGSARWPHPSHPTAGSPDACSSTPPLLQRLVYEDTEGDEVEDLACLLAYVRERHPEVTAVSSGAIASGGPPSRPARPARRCLASRLGAAPAQLPAHAAPARVPDSPLCAPLG